MSLFDDIKEEVKPYFLNAKGSHDWDHVKRVYNLCLQIGKKENANIEVLKLAALLHDVARAEEQESKGKICHAERSAEIAKEILKKHNLDKETIEKIVHCIEAHRKKGKKKPETLEAKILFDADGLDALGATGIGRLFLYAGEIGSRLHIKDVDLEKHREYSKEDTAYREFNASVKYIKDRMLTTEGKRIAEERHKFMANFFNRLNNEIDGMD
jgi:uncharacterized protein